MYTSHVLRPAGMTRQLLRELDDPSDILACLAALNLVQELAQQRSAGMARLLCDLLLPRLLQLLQQPLLAAGTLPIAAQLLAAALEAGPADMEGARPANGHGGEGHPLLAAIGQALDERCGVDCEARMCGVSHAASCAHHAPPTPCVSILRAFAIGAPLRDGIWNVFTQHGAPLCNGIWTFGLTVLCIHSTPSTPRPGAMQMLVQSLWHWMLLASWHTVRQGQSL